MASDNAPHLDEWAKRFVSGEGCKRKKTTVRRPNEIVTFYSKIMCGF